LTELLEYFQVHSGGLTVLFAAVVAIATIVYAFLTWRLVGETRTIRKLDSDPVLSIHISPSHRWIHILMVTIENTSRSPILDLRFETQPPIEDLASSGTKLEFLKNLNNLQYLAPGQKITSFYGSALEILKNNPAPKVKISVKYKDIRKQNHNTTFLLDPNKFRGLSNIGKPAEDEISKSLEKLTKAITSVVKSNRLCVRNMTETEWKNEQKEIRRELDELRERRRRNQGK